MTVDAAVLLNELQQDPKGLHYAGQPPDGMAALLNTVGLSGETCANTKATMANILIAVDLTELRALDQRTWEYLQLVAQQPTVDLTLDPVWGKVAEIFPAGGPSVQALATLKLRACSRAEALFGPGATVTADDVVSAAALAGGHI